MVDVIDQTMGEEYRYNNAQRGYNIEYDYQLEVDGFIQENVEQMLCKGDSKRQNTQYPNDAVLGTPNKVYGIAYGK